jgi:hypothetical protein
MPAHLGLKHALQKPAGKLLYQPVLPEDFFLGQSFKVDLVQHQVPLVLLFLFSFGRKFSLRYPTGLRPFTQTFLQAPAFEEGEGFFLYVSRFENCRRSHSCHK